MTLQLLHSEFPYIWGKLDFLFYQCTLLRRLYRLGYFPTSSALSILILLQVWWLDTCLIQYIHPSPLAEVPLHLLIAGQLSGKTSLGCRVGNRIRAPGIEFEPALQQADALPSELLSASSLKVVPFDRPRLGRRLLCMFKIFYLQFWTFNWSSKHKNPSIRIISDKLHGLRKMRETYRTI
jgi:hypothetical protein